MTPEEYLAKKLAEAEPNPKTGIRTLYEWPPAFGIRGLSLEAIPPPDFFDKGWSTKAGPGLPSGWEVIPLEPGAQLVQKIKMSREELDRHLQELRDAFGPPLEQTEAYRVQVCGEWTEEDLEPLTLEDLEEGGGPPRGIINRGPRP